MTALLVILAVAFAWSMGAHYTGACMGMPHALRAVNAWQALIIMAPLAWLGAAFASHAVEYTVAHRLTARPLGVGAEVVVIAVAFALTTAFTRLKVPTSTIQILVFAMAGAALADRVGVAWPAIGLLAVVWVAAPFVAAGLGFGFTRILDLVPAIRSSAAARQVAGVPAAGVPVPGVPAAGVPAAGAVSVGVADADTADTADTADAGSGRAGAIGAALVIVGAAASFVMGGNDVANATGSLVAVGAFSPLKAGVVGGAGLALGVLTWGRPLLNRVAFDIVKLDRPMATAAQGVQALVVLAAVSFGFFTSMNQALVGAMAGAGAARGRETVNRRVLGGILRGWVIGPGAGLTIAYLVARVILVVAGRGALG